MIIDLNKLNIPLNQALDLANQNDTILLRKDYTYHEKVVVSIPYLTIIGDNSTISFEDCHSALRGGKKVGTTGSSTFRVLEAGIGFKAENVTFVNGHKRKQSHSNQAVAFKAECSNLLLKNCRFLSTQDTFYLDYGKNNKVQNCYIEGDVDFIFGSADALFLNCHVHAIDYEASYYTAPDTFLSNKQGFIFKDCTFTTNSKSTYLGRRWYPSGAKEAVFPRVSFIHCSFDSKVSLEMLQMHIEDPKEGMLNLVSCSWNNKIINSFDKEFIDKLDTLD